MNEIHVYFVRDLCHTISTVKICIIAWDNLKMLSVFLLKRLSVLKHFLIFFYSWNSNHFNQDTEDGAAAGTAVTAESNYSSFCDNDPSNTRVAARGGQNFQMIPVVMLLWLLLLLPREVKAIHRLQNETLNFRGWHLTLTLSDSWPNQKRCWVGQTPALHTPFSFFPVNVITIFNPEFLTYWFFVWVLGGSCGGKWSHLLPRGAGLQL